MSYENCITHGRVNEIILHAQQRAAGVCWMDALQTVMRQGEIDLCKDKMKQTGKDFYNCLISFRVYE